MTLVSPLILASSSPRRQELLTQMGLRFNVMVADIDESIRAGETPNAYVLRLALEKAMRVQHKVQPLTLTHIESSQDHKQTLAITSPIIIAADTSVCINGEILGKPEDENHAITMWQKLSGGTHQVLTGVAVQQGPRCKSCVVTTDVTFMPLSIKQMQTYWLSGEPIGKAGGYAIQGRAAAFIAHINGSYSNVVGLPLFETMQLLQHFSK